MHLFKIHHLYKNGMHWNIALWIHFIHCENSQHKTKWSWQAVKNILWFSHFLSKEKDNAGSIPLLTFDVNLLLLWTYTVCHTCCHLFSYHCFSYPSWSNFSCFLTAWSTIAIISSFEHPLTCDHYHPQFQAVLQSHALTMALNSQSTVV